MDSTDPSAQRSQSPACQVIGRWKGWNGFSLRPGQVCESILIGEVTPTATLLLMLKKFPDAAVPLARKEDVP